ncbi:hypothetical protein [Streptomyces sp. NPDC006267]|uniref:hypothetical protein n=1 Tax=Streptomyces sp. NPDC006267 TaxID=3157173 RepID=UPI00339FC363
MFGRSTPAERQAAAALLSEVADGGALTTPGGMTDASIARQVTAARQLNDATGGDKGRIAVALADVREAAIAAETSR